MEEEEEEEEEAEIPPSIFKKKRRKTLPPSSFSRLFSAFFFRKKSGGGEGFQVERNRRQFFIEKCQLDRRKRKGRKKSFSFALDFLPFFICLSRKRGNSGGGRRERGRQKKSEKLELMGGVLSSRKGGIFKNSFLLL